MTTLLQLFIVRTTSQASTSPKEMDKEKYKIQEKIFIGDGNKGNVLFMNTFCQLTQWVAPNSGSSTSIGFPHPGVRNPKYYVLQLLFSRWISRNAELEVEELGLKPALQHQMQMSQVMV